MLTVTDFDIRKYYVNKLCPQKVVNNTKNVSQSGMGLEIYLYYRQSNVGFIGMLIASWVIEIQSKNKIGSEFRLLKTRINKANMSSTHRENAI